jgi:hypothetical protein
MKYTADYLLGRRYTMSLYRGNTIAGAIDVTVTGVHGCRARVHGEDGSRAWWSLNELIALIQDGQLVESVNGAGFVFERARGKKLS